MASEPGLQLPARRSGLVPGGGLPAPHADTAPLATPAGGPAARWVAVLLAEVAWPDRAWLFSRLVLGPRALAAEPGLRFARVLGSGQGGGFGLRPSFAHGGVIGFFDTEAAALRFVQDSATAERYRRHSASMLTAVLATQSARGRWAGARLLPAEAGVGTAPPGVVAALTRASIRPQRALQFWRHAPATEQALADAPGCLLVAGLGEAPLLRQATFSIWRDTAAMEAYARSGAHGQASRAAWQQQYFSESLFARFAVRSLAGRWQGREHGGPHA
jgi:heme-degrading monooxygenase HmoA